MAKKDFKTSVTQGTDKFFSVNDEKPQRKQEPKRTQEPHKTHEPQRTHKTYYRLNLKLDEALKEHIQEKAWKNKTSVTQYISDLIEKDTLDTLDTLDT